MSKSYTRRGDDGSTGLFGGPRVRKDDLRVGAYGEVDELNSALGMAREELLEPAQKDILGIVDALQSELFTLGSELATPQADKAPREVPRIRPEMVARMEKDIDRLTAELPEMRQFILPGGSRPGAALHLCRTVCRRAERKAVQLAREPGRPPPLQLPRRDRVPRPRRAFRSLHRLLRGRPLPRHLPPTLEHRGTRRRHVARGSVSRIGAGESGGGPWYRGRMSGRALKTDFVQSYKEHLADLLRSSATERQALEQAVGGEFVALGLLELACLQHYGLEPDHYLIDVGCGSGRLAKPLTQYLRGRYLGTDVVPELLSFAKKLC